MRNVMEAILHRRAIRRFDARQVEEGPWHRFWKPGSTRPARAAASGRCSWSARTGS